MSDPRASFPPPERGENTQGRARAAMAETLQQALKSLTSGAGGGPGGQTGLTPDALASMAQRAGLTNASQMADLARMIGIGGSAEAASVESPQDIVFALGDTECALAAQCVQGVERLTDITIVPNTVSWVRGIVQLRGSIVSVVDLRGFFGLPMQEVTARSRMLVVSKREMTIGFLVDAITEMRSLSQTPGASGPTRPTPEWAAPYTLRATNIDGRSIFLLDPERLLFADKMHRYRLDS